MAARKEWLMGLLRLGWLYCEPGVMINEGSVLLRKATDAGLERNEVGGLLLPSLLGKMWSRFLNYHF